MHGLINRALQRFAEDTFGLDLWSEIVGEVSPRLTNFEAMLVYEDCLTHSILNALAKRTKVPKDMLLEDMGTYLVSHPNTETLRRLMRFGGETFTDFLYSLDDLPDRVCLAVADLILPRLDLIEHAPGRFTLTAGPGLPGIGHVLLGFLRAMADDYGVLALTELMADGDEGSRLSVVVAEASFAEGRGFDLSPLGGNV